MIFELPIDKFMTQEGTLYYCQEDGRIVLFKIPSTSNIIFRSINYYPPMPDRELEMTDEEFSEAMESWNAKIINFKQTYTQQGVQITKYEKDADFKLTVTGDSSQ